jgi:hypothetical protein
MAAHLRAALAGVKLIYKFDARAWDFFDLTPAGFRHAFLVPLILAPLHIGHRLMVFDAEKSGSLAVSVTGEVLNYVVSWLLFPFAMLYIAPLLARAPRYHALLVPYFWMQLPISLVLSGLQLLVDVGMLPVEVMGPLQLIILAVYAIYGTFVAGIGLGITTGAAFGLVVLDVVLGLLLYQIVNVL